MVLRLGVSTERIVFANACKRPRDIRHAAEKQVRPRLLFSRSVFDLLFCLLYPRKMVPSLSLCSKPPLSVYLLWKGPRGHAAFPPKCNPHLSGHLVDFKMTERAPFASRAFNFCTWRREGPFCLKCATNLCVQVNLTTFDTASELAKLARWHPATRALVRIRADDPAARCQLGNKYGAEPADVPSLLQVRPF